MIDICEGQRKRERASDEAKWTIVMHPVVIDEPLEQDGDRKYDKP